MYQRVHVEISNICNVQCSFCPIVTKPKEILSLDKFKYILNQVAPLTKDICLHLLGEPLAHPSLVQILEACDEQQASIQLTTNGLLIKKYCDQLIESSSLRQINFSLQVFKDNYPDQDPRDYLERIFAFTKKALEIRPDLYINFRLWDVGAQDNSDILEFIEESFDCPIKRSLDVGHIKSKNLLGRLYLHFDSRFDWPSPYFPTRSNTGYCYGLSSHFGIHADGTVVPCCLDKDAIIDLGNIFKTPLKDILSSTRSREMVTGFKKGELVEDLCKRCTFIKRFDRKAKKLALESHSKTL